MAKNLFGTLYVHVDKDVERATVDLHDSGTCVLKLYDEQGNNLALFAPSNLGWEHPFTQAIASWLATIAGEPVRVGEDNFGVERTVPVNSEDDPGVHGIAASRTHRAREVTA
jgi:hypothetical protein